MFAIATATNGSDTEAVNGTVEGNKVSFTDLYPGAAYKVSLFYVINQEKRLLCSHSLSLGGFVAFINSTCNIQHTSNKPFQNTPPDRPGDQILKYIYIPINTVLS